MIIKKINKRRKDSFRNSSNRRFMKAIFLLFSLLILFFAWIAFSRNVKQYGYSNGMEFLSYVSSNYLNSLKSKPEEISIKIKKNDLHILERNRTQALERGVIINDMDGEYVPAELEYAGKTLKVKLRLKGHMTDHLQENKWSFRIKVKDNGSFMGMKRFSIQHPGTRGYIYEWIYHKLMKEQGIIALRYKFINVTVNGKNWGIYAVEENFEKELIRDNNRSPGPIIRFDPDLYWVNRYNMMKGQSAPDEFARYYSANPVAYREDDVLSDSVQHFNFEKAFQLIEKVRSRNLPVHDAFDVKLLARFHAIIDLVGGQHSIDWSDIKYYYNPVTAKLEPVAYESFTSFPVRELSGMYRFVKLKPEENYKDWHTALFSDSVFFGEYIKQLEHISDKTFLDAFFKKSDVELQKNLNILNKEFPYKQFKVQDYYNSQLMIKKMLHPPQALRAYFDDAGNGKLTIRVGNIESLPLVIHSVLVNGKALNPSSPLLLQAKQPDVFIDYKTVGFNFPGNFIWKDSFKQNIKLIYSILGSSVIRQQKVLSYRYPDISFTNNSEKYSNFNKFNFLYVNNNNKTIIVKPGHHVLKETLIIPEGYSLLAGPGVRIDLKNESKIISTSPVFFSGTEENPVVIESSDLTGGISILNSITASKFIYTKFIGLNKSNTDNINAGSITINNSEVIFKNCNFFNFRSNIAISTSYSVYSCSGCLFQNAKDTVFQAFYSKGAVSNTVFENCANAMNVKAGFLYLKNVYCNGICNYGIDAQAGAEIKADHLTIKNSSGAVCINNNSKVILKNIKMENLRKGFLIDNKLIPDSSFSELTINGFHLNKVTTEFLTSKHSNLKLSNRY